MDKETLSKYRSEIIEKFINCETIIDSIITLHYFKNEHGILNFSFMMEVLYDEYFTFALKRRILLKIVPNIDNKKIQDLNRLNTIRNYFAHYNQQWFDGPPIPKPGEWGMTPDPRDTDREINFEKMHKEFIKKEKKVLKYLFKIYRDMGASLTKQS